MNATQISQIQQALIERCIEVGFPTNVMPHLEEDSKQLFLSGNSILVMWNSPVVWHAQVLAGVRFEVTDKYFMIYKATV